MFAFEKNKRLHAMLEEYAGLARDTLVQFREAVEYLFEHEIDDHYAMLTDKTHRCESNADDLRRQIELFMYEKSLLPETRRDLLLIIEEVDHIPNRAERIVYMFLTQKTKIYPPIQEDLKELLALSMETFEETISSVLDCFGKMANIRGSNRKVDNNESLGDHLERKMITKVFESDLDVGEKILQKQFIQEFGAICDLCETTLDRVVLCSVKRHF